MTTRPFLAFACAHMTDERLYAHQVAALSATHDCRVFVFRDHDTMGGMAHDILLGARGQFNQQTAMLGRPDSHADLKRVQVPTLLVCGRQDPVTPLSDHQAMAACVAGSRLEVIEDCGHLSTIEQPVAVTRVLVDWLASTQAA